MPQVIIPVAIAAAGAAFGVAIGVTTVTAAIIGVAVTAASVGAGYLLSKGNNVAPQFAASEGPAAAPINGQRNIVAREAIPPRRIAYGRVRIGGALIFQDNDNPTLYMLLALSDGEIDSLVSLYIGEQSVPLTGTVPSTGTTYDGRLELELREGTASQTASALLTAAFPTTLTSDFRQRGVATLALALDWGDDATMHSTLWGNGVTPSVVLDAALVVDPRVTGTSPDSSTARAFSSNPALGVADALVRAWDLALSYDDVDWETVAEAADDCDEVVSYMSESLPIFEMAGVFQAGADLAGQLAGMLSAFGGALYFDNGVYKLRADKARSSVWTITDYDIIEIGEFVHEGEAAEVPNAIKARYYDQSADSVETTTPVYEDASFGTEALREMALSLPFTPRTHSAQILAYRELTRARDGRMLPLTTNDAGIYLEPFDVVTISSAAAPWIDGDYQVVQVDLASPGAVLILRGYDPAVYADPTTYLQ